MVVRKLQRQSSEPGSEVLKGRQHHCLRRRRLPILRDIASVLFHRHRETVTAGALALSFSMYRNWFRRTSAVLPSARSMRGSSENNSGRPELFNCSIVVATSDDLAAPGVCARAARRSTQSARLRA